MEKLLEDKVYIDNDSNLFYKRVAVKSGVIYLDLQRMTDNVKLDYQIPYGYATTDNLKEVLGFVESFESEDFGSLKYLIDLAESKTARKVRSPVLADWVYRYSSGATLMVSEGEFLYEWLFDLGYFYGSAGMLLGVATRSKLNKLNTILNTFENKYLYPLQEKITSNSLDLLKG